MTAMICSMMMRRRDCSRRSLILPPAQGSAELGPTLSQNSEVSIVVGDLSSEVLAEECPTSSQMCPAEEDLDQSSPTSASLSDDATTWNDVESSSCVQIKVATLLSDWSNAADWRGLICCGCCCWRLLLLIELIVISSGTAAAHTPTAYAIRSRSYVLG
mgnify:CR=1 FL=1